MRVWMRRVATVTFGALLILPAFASGGVSAEETHTYNCIPGAGLSTQSLTIPAGVTSVTITASGAQGGASRDGSGVLTNEGGLGGDVQATMAVHAGDVIYLQVGCVGEDAPSASGNGGAGGTGFGGDGGATAELGEGGGGGGGQTRVMLNGTAVANIVVIAGGGGGAGSGDDAGVGGLGGGGAGQPGTDGTGGLGGGGGGQPGCTGGVGWDNNGGGCLTLGGGAGGGNASGILLRGGGGGGGGNQGGGGGGDGNDDSPNSGGGGGGGSSIVNSPAVEVAIEGTGLGALTHSGNGVLSITFTVGTAAVVGTPALTG